MTGKKYDQGKPRYDLTPVYAEEEVVKVLTFGAELYGDENWREVENARSRYVAAAKRHIAEYRKGIRADKDTGLHPLAHAVCDLMFVVELDLADERAFSKALDLSGFMSEDS